MMGHLIGESDADKLARRNRRLYGPPEVTPEQLRDEQVARETVRPRAACPHCNPGALA